MTYSYDGASQLAGINYALGGTALGNLTYAYDLAGRRTAVGGSFARSNVPAALTSASYNANNQMMQFGAASLAYDLNGNLTSDGTNTYTWNARNQLTRISGGVAASFQYDAFGRRVSKTVGSTTEYLYDGVNPVQELSGGTESANLLMGLGVDEYFRRTDASGSANFLTDALGSTLALTDSGGNSLASYTYEPFGNTTVTGSSTNPFQFTGRENDLTGLYFHRARYYSPAFGRFISEDPIGLVGGFNLVRYASDDPINLSDTSGLAPIDWVLPDWLYDSVNWNYVPAACSADSFRFYGGGPTADPYQAGAFHLTDVHYANSADQGWHIAGMDEDTLYEAAHGMRGVGVVMHGRKPEEALYFGQPIRGKEGGGQIGPVSWHAVAGVGPLIGYSRGNGLSVGFYGEVEGDVTGGGYGAFAGGGGGWSVNLSSAASCIAR